MCFEFAETKNTLLQSDSGYSITIAGEIHFDSLHFNPNSGSYLKNTDASISLFASLNTHNKTLAILPASTVRFEKNIIGFNGNFEIRKEGKYAMQFRANNVDLAKAQKLLNPKLNTTLSKFKCEKPVTVEIILRASLSLDMFRTLILHLKQETLIAVCLTGFFIANAEGSFTNHANDIRKRQHDSKVVISHSKAQWRKFQLKVTSFLRNSRIPL